MTVTLFYLSPVLQASVGMDDLKASWFEHSSSSQLFALVYFVRPFKSNDKFVVMCWIFIFYTKCSLSAYFISIPFCCAQWNLVEFKEEFLDVKPNHTWCSVGAPIDWVDHFGMKASFRPGSLDYLLSPWLNGWNLTYQAPTKLMVLPNLFQPHILAAPYGELWHLTRLMGHPISSLLQNEMDSSRSCLQRRVQSSNNPFKDMILQTFRFQHESNVLDNILISTCSVLIVIIAAASSSSS